MLPRTLLPSLAENAPRQGGSAKSLGLVRDHDSGSTATVARSEEDEDQLAETGRRSDMPPPPSGERVSDGHDGHGDQDADDNLATVMRGQKRLAKNAFEDEDMATPVGVKKIPRPSEMEGPEALPTSAAPSGPPAPITAPDSGQTRVARIVAPSQVQHPPIAQQQQPMMMMHAPPRSAPTGPMQNLLHAGTAKALALPPHRIALLVSSVLLFAAVLFLVLRRPAHPVETPPNASNAFPPAPVLVAPVEVAPPAMAVNGVIAPPAAPTPIVSAAAAQPREPRAPIPHHRPRAVRPTNIPVHREQ